MACPRDNISLPATGDHDTVCADCGAIIHQPRKANDTWTATAWKPEAGEQAN